MENDTIPNNLKYRPIESDYSFFDNPKFDLFSDFMWIDPPRQPDLQDYDFGKMQQKLGGRDYEPLPNEALWMRARNYYEQHIGDIEEMLQNAQLSHDKVEIVKSDYGNALLGNYTFSASVMTMREVLQKITPRDAFFADRYGFHFVLLAQYYRYAKTIVDHEVFVRYATAEVKTKYLKNLPALSLRATAWGMRCGYISLTDFAGVPPEDTVRFVENVRYIEAFFDYGQFYHFAKCALLATPEELAQIHVPEPIRSDKDPIKDAEAFCVSCEAGIEKAKQQYIAEVQPDQQQPTEPTPAAPYEGKWNAWIRQSVNLTTIQQKPIEVHTKYKTDTLPIRQYIEAFPLMQGYEKFKGLVTEQTLQTVIGGLDAMRSYSGYSKVKAVNGLSTYHISMEDFAKICGYSDANQNDKTGLLGGLLMLNNLYVHCDRPIRIRKGKKIKFSNSGWLKIMDLRYYSDNGNDLIIDIIESELGGELMPITADTYLKIRQEAKGMREQRFTRQLEGKDNKNEEKLIDDVFGYEDMLKYAQPNEIKDIKTYIRKHRSDARKKIQEWFDKYEKMGVIKDHTRTQNKAGEWVHKWKRSATQALPEPTNEPTPNAEKVQDEQPTGEQ